MIHAARQLAWHLLARHPLPAPGWLTPPERALFDRMPPPDQREALAVARSLAANGWSADRDLLLAALLHDAGKSLAPPKARYRVLMTALDTLAPSLLLPLARRSPAIATLARHAKAGSELAVEAGLQASVVHLIANHHSPPADARAQALQRADARN